MRPLKCFKQGRDLIHPVPPLGSCGWLPPSAWLPVQGALLPAAFLLMSLDPSQKSSWTNFLPTRTPQVWLPPSGHTCINPGSHLPSQHSLLALPPQSHFSPPFSFRFIAPIQGPVCPRCQGVHVSVSMWFSEVHQLWLRERGGNHWEPSTHSL